MKLRQIKTRQNSRRPYKKLQVTFTESYSKPVMDALERWVRLAFRQEKPTSPVKEITPSEAFHDWMKYGPFKDVMVEEPIILHDGKHDKVMMPKSFHRFTNRIKAYSEAYKRQLDLLIKVRNNKTTP